VSIGHTLADARHQAGLTVADVSHGTRIGESIIRDIEQDDFSSCGDFYARGHIRSIAAAIGLDPVPLIREYDAEHGPPSAIRAADVFEPSTPIKIRERRSPSLSLIVVVVLLAVSSYVTVVISHSWLYFFLTLISLTLIVGCLLFFFNWRILRRFKVGTLQRRISSTPPGREDERTPGDDEGADKTPADVTRGVANVSEQILIGASAVAGITAIVGASTGEIPVAGPLAATAVTSLLPIAIAAIQRRREARSARQRAQAWADKVWDAIIATREG
jgi:uncharacterized membrane protein